MYSLAVPTRNGIEVFDNIVARRESDARTLLNRHRANIANAYGNYLTHSGNGVLLDPINIDDEVAEVLKANFRLLDKGRSHSFVRDEILGSARFDACPYCNATTVDSLDHALPTTVYPEFTVLAQNLVPACGPCNRKKGQECFKKSGMNLMHPYFVQIPDAPILFASVVVEEREVTWEFYLQQNGHIDDGQFESIDNLFKLLDLADLYHQVSVGDIIDRTGHLNELHQGGGAAEVRRYFEMEADSSRKSRGENYWKTAILRALAKSADFCNGEHQLLSVSV